MNLNEEAEPVEVKTKIRFDGLMASDGCIEQ
jgi:hypothetical protein